MKATSKRNRLSKFLILACALVLLVSSVSTLAFFTDRVTADATAKSGSIDLVWNDISASKTGTNGITSLNEFAVDKAWDSQTGLVSEKQIINPGDFFDLSYDLDNNGNKSIDVRQRIILKSSVALTADAPEYALTITGGNDQASVVPEKADEMTLIYDLADITINGVGDGAESEEGAVDGKYIVKLDFAKAAKNAFMDSTVEINLYAAAKQHRNTEATDFPAFENIASIMSNDAWETK
jgi:predicted ribosomally synthesized peptide with SipW-like signal peptide